MLLNRVNDISIEQGYLKRKVTDLVRLCESKQLVSIKYAVRVLNLKPDSIRNAVKRGRIIGYRVPLGQYVLTKQSVERYAVTRGVARGRKRSVPEPA